jgi:hypothetical protein
MRERNAIPAGKRCEHSARGIPQTALRGIGNVAATIELAERLFELSAPALPNASSEANV